MNEKIQDSLNEMTAEFQDPDNATASISEMPLITPEILEKDRDSKIELVEINIKDQSAQIVETSDAPKLTEEILQERAQPIKEVAMLLRSTQWQVHIRHGRTTRLDILQSRLFAEFGDPPNAEEDGEKHEEWMDRRERECKNLILSHMSANPEFSWRGSSDALAIESQSDIFVNALWAANISINNSIEDEIYQTTVLKGSPIHANLLLDGTFELYPLGESLRISEMSDADLDAHCARFSAQRNIWVASMIEGVSLSLNSEGKQDAFPVEDLAQAWLSTLYEAHEVVNTPRAARMALRRFQRKSKNAQRENNVA